MHRGDYAAACPLLSESENLDPQIGTALNLAYCYEKLGRTATAWSVWLDAAAAAAVQGDRTREEAAIGQAGRIEPELLRVTITVEPQSAGDTIRLAVDGVPLPRTEWGLPIPLDPGEHELEAAADGFRPWSRKFTVARGVGSMFRVPKLDASLLPKDFLSKPADTTAKPAGTDTKPADMGTGRASPTGRRSVWPAVAWTAGAAGLAALATGGGFGIAALANEATSKADRNCVGSACNQTGYDARSRAVLDSRVADVTLASGAAALAAGAGIFFALRSPGSFHSSGAWTASVGFVPGGGAAASVARRW